MSGLRARAEEYLAMRRALGFKLETWGPRLMSFLTNSSALLCNAADSTTALTKPILSASSASRRSPVMPSSLALPSPIKRDSRYVDPLVIG